MLEVAVAQRVDDLAVDRGHHVVGPGRHATVGIERVVCVAYSPVAVDRHDHGVDAEQRVVRQVVHEAGGRIDDGCTAGRAVEALEA